MDRQTRTLLLAVVPFTFGALAAELANTRTSLHPRLDLTVVVGDVSLPSGGLWQVSGLDPADGPITQAYTAAPDVVKEQLKGRRLALAEQSRKASRARYPLRSVWHAVVDYARSHNGVGPSRIEDLEGEKSKKLLQNWHRSPWPDETEVNGPFRFLVPGVKMTFRAEDRRGTPTNNKPLVLELRPYVDDGKHWVLSTNGRVTRVPIDRALLAEHGVQVRPVLPKPGTGALPGPGPVPYRLLALLVGDPAGTVRVHLHNTLTRERMSCPWDLRAPQPGHEEAVGQWALARATRWTALANAGEAPILRHWLSRCEPLYGTKPEGSAGPRRARGRTTNMFNVLGGRAAIRGTLQLEQLQARPTPDGKPATAHTMPLSEIAGIEVKSHPFAEMLGGAPGGSLDLARSVPADRFFVHVSKPRALAAYLDSGAPFVARFGSVALGNAVSYGLEARYLARLGMDRKWLQLVLESGVIAELGLVMPDLFLIDGTELTVISRVPRLALIKPFLLTLGVAGLSDGAVVRRQTPDGAAAFWAAADDLLLVSTNEKELRRILALEASGGKDSLGASAEFRYMLTQLPTGEATRVYAYFSDPFVRHLVSPATKIGQLRRLRARAAMEATTAGALHYAIDGPAHAVSVPDLAELGYIPEALVDTDVELREDGGAISPAYGVPERLTTLANMPFDRVSTVEADAYKRYVDNYSRYWRQFFDPIAVRLDDTPDGGLELTTFILPLLDSEVYSGLREAVAPQEAGTALRVPVLEPEPTLQFSLNLTDRAWTEFVEKSGLQLQRLTGINPMLFDHLGPSLHLALPDADPIIALGSGDLLGVFGGNARMRGPRAQMLTIPVLLSVLTRPAVIAVELKDPDAVRAALHRSGGTRREGRGFGEVQASFCRLEGRDAWLYTATLFGTINLRLGFEIDNGFLLIKNLPWSQPVRVAAVPTASLCGAQLRVSPQVIEQQLPALFTAACGQQRRAAFQGMGYLYPLTMVYGPDAARATKLHRDLFGFAPYHPHGGDWCWHEGQLASTRFGTPWRQTQPSYAEGTRDFGLLHGVQGLSLGMQLEDTGLRTVMRWKWVAAE